MKDYIVAIDLGTSHLAGVVGEKQPDGRFSIVTYDTEDTASGIRRGNIYNQDDTVKRVKSLIRKFESKLKDSVIMKVYIGVGGQSLRTIEHAESKEIEDGAVVTAEDVNELKEKCETYIPDLQDVLAIAPSVFYLDGQRELKPEGVACKQLEARYKLITGRRSIRRDIVNSITEKAGKEVAQIIVSPLSLADAMLSSEEKELGCAVVDFGAGVTTVTIYKNGELLSLSVIPLGSNLITKDIASLQIPEAEAERLKIEYGSAIVQKENECKKIPINIESLTKEIEADNLNAVIEARITEIVENAIARIKDVIELRLLGNGIVLAGCASNLNNLPEFIKDKYKVNARLSAIRGGLVSGKDDIIGDPVYMTAVSIMLKGTEQCISFPYPDISYPADKNTDEEIGKKDEKKEGKNERKDDGRKSERKDDGRKERGKERKNKWKDRIGKLFAD